MSLAGLTLGKLAASKIPIRTDLLGGVVMLILACAMVVRA
jgi:putative Mn2+ efflux pump MntP